MVARHPLVADQIEHVTLEMNYLETLYPSPRFPRPPAADGSGFGRTAYMLAYTRDRRRLSRAGANVEDPRDAGAAADAELAARVAALQQRVEILGVVGRECFAPRMTVSAARRPARHRRIRRPRADVGLRAGTPAMLRRFVPGLPIAPAQYDRFVAAVAGLDKAESVDEVVALTLPK